MDPNTFDAKFHKFRQGGDLGCCAFWVVPAGTVSTHLPEISADAASAGLVCETFVAGQRTDCKSAGLLIYEA